MKLHAVVEASAGQASEDGVSLTSGLGAAGIANTSELGKPGLLLCSAAVLNKKKERGAHESVPN